MDPPLIGQTSPIHTLIYFSPNNRVTGKNGQTNQIRTILADHPNILTANVIGWPIRSGREWSMYLAFPMYENLQWESGRKEGEQGAV